MEEKIKEKRILTPEQIYNRNKKLSRFLGILSPVVFWGGLALAVLCLYVAFASSFGNVNEMLDLLDKTTHTGEELSANYNYLISKYGEWIIGTGSGGFQIEFINIKKVFFSGMMITNLVLSGVWLLVATLGGKWLLPRYSKKIADSNQDTVNLAVLKSTSEQKE